MKTKAFTIWTRTWVVPSIYRGTNGGYIITEGMNIIAMVVRDYFSNGYATLKVIDGCPRAFTIKRHD